MGESAKVTGKKVAVIGSGFGGLAAAIRLQTAGHQVVLYEAMNQLGGRARCWDREGYHFDGGPTVITAPHTLEELFALSGRRMADYVELIPVTPFYRLLWSDGRRFDYDGDPESMRKQIAAFEPRDVEGYERFVSYSKRVFDKGYTELAAQPFQRLLDMVRVGPELALLRADRSVYDTVARFVSEEHLRQAFSFHSLLVGGNPFETSAIYTLIHFLERKWGVSFPRGGTTALVQALARLFGDLGGELRLHEAVERVELERGNGALRHRVSSAGGDELYDAVVSNADLGETYGRLYGKVPEAARQRRRLQHSQWSMSLFVLYFGVSKTFSDLAHHTVLFGPRYRELLREIFHGSHLPDDFSLYLHAPTVTDPSLAPPGCTTFYVLSPVPHLGNAPIRWEEEGDRYAARILAALEPHLPGLREHLVTQHWVAPPYFRDQLRARHGAAFSLAPSLNQSAWFRPHNADERIPGLFLVGAGTHPGAGLPGVISSAAASSRLVEAYFAAAR